MRGLWLVVLALFTWLAACAAPPVLPAKGPMPPGATWAGKWDTTWGELEMQQTGSQVRGSYQYRGVLGSLVGNADGNYLEFSWTESQGGAGKGLGVFVMEAGGRSFTGGWGSDERRADHAWTGTRIGEAPAVATEPVAPATAAAPAQPPAAAPLPAQPAAPAQPPAAEVAKCATDPDCPGGTFCKDGRCTAECSSDPHCPATSRCDSRVGRCVPKSQ